MVAPDLEVPGKMAAISWKSPTSIASRYVIWAILVMRLFRLIFIFDYNK